jgi:hypothetical protein
LKFAGVVQIFSDFPGDAIFTQSITVTGEKMVSNGYYRAELWYQNKHLNV